MSGTDLPFCLTPMAIVLCRYHATKAIFLRCCPVLTLAMRLPDSVAHATPIDSVRSLVLFPLSRYALATRCPVLTWHLTCYLGGFGRYLYLCAALVVTCPIYLQYHATRYPVLTYRMPVLPQGGCSARVPGTRIAYSVSCYGMPGTNIRYPPTRPWPTSYAVQTSTLVLSTAKRGPHSYLPMHLLRPVRY
eukprot:1880201-Rhodomonas_salina.2